MKNIFFWQYPLNGEVEDGGTVTVTGPGSWSLDTMCVDWDNDNNLVVTCGLDITAVNTDTQVVPQIDPSVKLYNHGEGPSRGLLRVCTTSPMDRFAALVSRSIARLHSTK